MSRLFVVSGIVSVSLPQAKMLSWQRQPSETASVQKAKKTRLGLGCLRVAMCCADLNVVSQHALCALVSCCWLAVFGQGCQ